MKINFKDEDYAELEKAGMKREEVDKYLKELNEAPPAPEKVELSETVKKMVPEGFVLVSKSELAELKSNQLDAEKADKTAKAEALFTRALSEGKAFPSQKETIIQLAMKDYDSAVKWVESTPVIVQLKEVYGTKDTDTDPTALTEDDKQMAAKIGVSEDAYQAAKRQTHKKE